jgi:hypothetical protein
MPLGADLWHFRRSASGAKSWTHPDPPPGLSLLSVAQTPAGDLRCRVEGNLTTLYAGNPDAAVASLMEDELPGAVDALVGTAQDLLENSPVPELHRWDVHRLDPSQTLVLPESTSARAVVEGMRKAWATTRRKGTVLSGHNEETVTLRLSKHRSWTVYDKAAEALKKGNRLTLPTGHLLRMEARLRPRQDKSETGKDWNPTLNLGPRDVDMVSKELDALGEALSQVSASTQLLQVRAFLRGGATPNEAMRLSTVASLVASFGPEILTELGAPERTADRWRSDVKKYLVASDPTGDPLEGAIDDLPTVVRMAQRLSLSDVLPDGA